MRTNRSQAEYLQSQYCSKNVIPYQIRLGFLFMNFHFQSAAGQKSEFHVGSPCTFQLLLHAVVGSL